MMAAASILIKATVVIALALAATRMARDSRAAVRHVLLVAAFAVLLILPIASIIAPSVRVSVPIAMPGAIEPFADESVTDFAPSGPSTSGTPVAASEPLPSSWLSLSALLLDGGRLHAGAMARHAVWGNRFAAWLIRVLYGVKITDLGPFRAARADVLRALDLRETTYGWAVELIVRGALQGYRVVEVPVSYYPRIGRSKISGTLRGSVGAGYGILSGVLKYRLRRS